MKKHFCGQSFWTGKAKWNGETTNGASVTQCWTGGVGTLISSSCHRQRTHHVEKWRKFESFPEMHRACHGNCKSGKLPDYKVESWTLFEFGGRSRHISINYRHRNGSVGLPWGSSESSKSLSQKLWSVHQRKTIHHLIDPKRSAKLQILIHGGIQGTRWCV